MSKLKLKLVVFALLLLAGIAYYLALPKPLFSPVYSTVLEARNGELLAAAIATDGQWRFPLNDSVPERFKSAILTFEDEHFESHPGFNPFSLMRAAWQNLEAGRVVSGGSTLSMQLIRLSRNGQPERYGKRPKKLYWLPAWNWRIAKRKFWLFTPLMLLLEETQ